MEEAEGRFSTTEDTDDDLGSHLTGMEKTVEQLQLKVDDLENLGRRKNLKIINLPEKAEGNTSSCRLSPNYSAGFGRLT